ncbi:MarR family transcriptional regulator [Micromonospora phytophila]|uniref:MarR family transcriptional regulator n=1 Tax=Micromonospora phytophila TaxID=709888 RepID=UPI0020302976|nr:MarR family transcriptional regulator [Micromonospora phytophila]MCM0673673.1 MarR family transcriptional regulator [Micromonospora phytophila]
MEHLSLTPATQAVLDALTELGHGNVHELADQAGKARSTTDKAIKTLADAGVIVAVQTDADPAEGTPTRWTLATPAEIADTAADDAGLGDEHATGADEADLADPGLNNAADEPGSEAADNPGDAVDGDGGNEAEDGVSQQDETADAEPAAQPRDAFNRSDDAETSKDRDGETDIAANETGAADDDSDKGADRGQDEGRTVVQPTRPGDRKVMAIKGVLADYGDSGATLDVIVAESGISHPTASRLLTAMEQADAARRLPGLPQRWIPGPTKASEVDPNPEPPRCPLCHQVIRHLANTPSATAAVLPLIRPDGTLHVVGPDGDTHVVTLPTRTPPRAPGITGSTSRRSDVSINADGSQPFGRGELEKLTLDILAAHPGRAMTPQDIATAISGQLARAVSSGAVRNNCTKAAAAGRIVLVSDAPLTFAYPAQPDQPAAEASAGSAGHGDNDAEQS